jgi:hypothetical protein
MERIENGLLQDDSKKKKGLGLFKKDKKEEGEVKEEKKVKQDSVEFWNEERKKLGLSELKSK